MFAPEALTSDGFLGGRVTCRQPARGFRSGTDAVLLAAAVAARPGETVLELGCGAGVALACLGARVGGLDLTGLELQPDSAALARDNLAANGLAGDIIEGDVTAPPLSLTARSFHRVFFNPPYFLSHQGTRAAEPGRGTAHHGGEDLLPAFCDQAIRRLRSRGTLTLILPAEALSRALAALDARVGCITILPIAGRANRRASRVILSARKGAKTPLCLLPPLVMHAAARHGTDGEDYSQTARAILRDGAALSLGS